MSTVAPRSTELRRSTGSSITRSHALTGGRVPASRPCTPRSTEMFNTFAPSGKSIPRIFAEDGEPHFRAAERDLVTELSARSGLVIAAGGGVVLDPDNISDFTRSGLVICLCATPESILDRVRHDTNRPLLAGSKMEKIKQILTTRRALYNAIPNQIDTTSLTLEQVVQEIRTLYRPH